MSQSEILIKERAKVMVNIASDTKNRTKWLVTLMDIDDEIEELSSQREKRIQEKMFYRFIAKS